MSHQMLTSTLEGVGKHPLFQRDRFGEMGLPRMAQRAVVSHQPRFSVATCPIPPPHPKCCHLSKFPLSPLPETAR